MHTYPWHVGDYLKDCAHLTNDEDLAYRRLMDLYYTQEGPIPDKTQWVAKRIRMVGNEVAIATVLKEFFERKDGAWWQKRCDVEIAKYQKKAATSRENGKGGGRPPGGNPAKTQRVTTRTRTKNQVNTPLPPEGAVVFDEIWNLHPRKVGKPKAMQAFAAALAKGVKPEDVLAGLKRHLPGWNAKKAAGEGDKIPHPTTWLNREGWNDEVMPEGSPGDGARADWWDSKQGLLDKGMHLGIPAPADEHPNTWAQFKAAVWVAAGEGPWWDKTSVAFPIAVRLRDGGGAVAAAVLAGLRKEPANA
jgi:uncharacterized protein YdaU (DUF1376 family)